MTSPSMKSYGSNPDIHRDAMQTTPTSSLFGNQRFKRVRDELSKDDFNSFKKEIKDMLCSWKSDQDSKFKKLETHIKQHISEMDKSLEFLHDENSQLRDMIKKVETENVKNLAQITALEEKVEDLQRNSKTTFIEIRNIPKKEAETKKDLISTVLTLARSLKVQIEPTDIRDSFRKISKGNNNTTIVELSNTAVKNSMLSSLKSYNISNPVKKLTTSDIGFSGTSMPIYMSEHLTINARRLYYLGRELRKINKMKYCWTSNGRVFVRKDDGLPAIVLRSESQAEAIKNE